MTDSAATGYIDIKVDLHPRLCFSSLKSFLTLTDEQLQVELRNPENGLASGKTSHSGKMAFFLPLKIS